MDDMNRRAREILSKPRDRIGATQRNGRQKYGSDGDRHRHDVIRDKFIEPIKWLEPRAYRNAGSAGIPVQINTIITVGGEVFGVAECRQRSRIYDQMELSRRNGFDPIVEYMRSSGNPGFVIFGFGDRLDVRVHIIDPAATLETCVGGRSDRSDPHDYEEMVRIPYRLLLTPSDVWKAAGLLQIP
jgi:hypothetical protein